MPTFLVSDPARAAAQLTGVFRAGADSSPLLDCFKVLAGLADVAVSGTDKTFECRYDYVGLKSTRGSSSSDRRITHKLFSPEVSVEDARFILEKVRFQNVNFFRKFLAELCFCLAERKRKNDVSSFLYLYRSVEHLAVSFPLFYFSRRSEFTAVNELLRSYFSQDAAKELKAITKFCQFIAGESEFLADYDVTFSPRGATDERTEEVQRQIWLRLPQEAQDRAELDGIELKISYQDVASAIISCRNMLFHNSNNGQNNFDLDSLNGANQLCGILVTGGLNWLALTYSEIIRDRASRV